MKISAKDREGMRHKRYNSVRVFSDGTYEHLMDCIKLNYDRVPEESKESVHFSISEGYYGNEPEYLSMSWYDKESDEDLDKRIEKMKVKFKEDEVKFKEKERKEYERLKKKFEKVKKK